MKPRIGITTSYADGEQQLRRDYVLAVEAAGGLPLPCPMPGSGTTTEAFLDLIDGLIVTGGPAVTDGMSGTLPHDLGPTDDVRSATDGHLLDLCDARELPVLGICYGMQLLNARAGGTIYADVENQLDGALVHSQTRGAAMHRIRVDADSHLARLLGTTEISVNSRHIQAIQTVGEGFRAVATAPDGVVEAIEHENGRILGVQFHPERMQDEMHPLFRDLVARTGRRTPVRDTQRDRDTPPDGTPAPPHVPASASDA
jgi:putative glutamine amidotransferase